MRIPVYDDATSSLLTLSPLSIASQAGKLIGCRCGGNGEFGGYSSTNFAGFFQTRHILPYGADVIQLVYGGFAKTIASSFQEVAIAPSVWRVAANTLTIASGGSSYAAGDTVTGPTGSGVVQPWIGRVLAVSSGAITKLQVIRPGMYVSASPNADGMSQSATSGSGTAATFNAQWEGFAMGGHLDIEPSFATFSMIGSGAAELVSQGGAYSDMTESWDFYVPPGDVFVSEPIPVDIAAGTAIGVRGEIVGFNPSTGRVAITSEYSVIASSFFERANAGTLTTSQANNILSPLGIIGVPKKVGPSVLVIGDSRIMYIGAGVDTMDTDGNTGWMERALASKIPSCNMARSSDKLANYINVTPPAIGRWGIKRAIQMLRPSAVYLNLSINDFVAGTSAATVLSWETQFVAWLRGLGVGQVFTDTCSPNTTSTDSWATLGNQTITSAGANAVTRNTSLRTGGYAGIYDFFIDWAGVTEDNSGGSPSGKWSVVGGARTTDGMHQNQATLITMGTTANPILLGNLR